MCEVLYTACLTLNSLFHVKGSMGLVKILMNLLIQEYLMKFFIPSFFPSETIIVDLVAIFIMNHNFSPYLCFYFHKHYLHCDKAADQIRSVENDIL